MSERGSFTTEYIYRDSDYEIIRSCFEKDRNKYLCCAPPAYWQDGDEIYYMKIVSGKVGGMYPSDECNIIVDCLEFVKTETTIKVVVMCDSGDIFLITKSPDGEVDSELLTVQQSNDEEGAVQND